MQEQGCYLNFVIFSSPVIPHEVYREPVYKFVLKNEKRKSYQRISQFIIIANILLFIYLLLFPPDNNILTSAGATLICVFLYYLVKYFFYRSQLFQEGWLFSVYHLFFIGFAGMGFYIPAVIVAVLAILMIIATREYTVLFYNDRIHYNAVPVKELPWKDLNNVILKDGLLTIDMKNNRLFQEELDSTKNNVDETEFNEFCRQQLNK